jgi:hypothetical protein
MWPMTPVVHMIYRLWQLGRGSLLVSVLDGPTWLIYLQARPACSRWGAGARAALGRRLSVVQGAVCRSGWVHGVLLLARTGGPRAIDACMPAPAALCREAPAIERHLPWLLKRTHVRPLDALRSSSDAVRAGVPGGAVGV